MQAVEHIHVDFVEDESQVRAFRSSGDVSSDFDPDKVEDARMLFRLAVVTVIGLVGGYFLQLVM